MDELTGTLNNWSLQKVTDEEFVIWGEVTGDIHNRFPDGTMIHTSGIRSRVIKEGDIVTTRNSTYLLGREKDC